ncbi:glycosyltransferase [Thomasclavelia cocleata]|jgi:glycosyltransferase involved in cell wall biosynthesis|uniref:glycosyltransferase n=1 Tax=Thomasclavelia cocleata TaxID=69824 RepID=UPI00241C96F0|nr:glycosyltransferase [Thomasclavelia cocleata]
MNDLISVIIPVYNVEKYLHRCVDSVINQTYSNLEIILVDDGSTDTSSQICDDYQKKDKRVKVIHKKNNGAATSRNIGLFNAKGDYIAFVDSDDYIELDMYENMMRINEKYDCDIVLCDCYKENKNERKVFTHNIREGYYDKEMLYKEYFPILLMTNSVDYPPTISNCVCLFNKTLLDRHHIFYKDGLRFSEDLLFGSQAIYYANSFYYMKDRYLYHYVMNGNSVTHTYYDDKWNMMNQLHNCISNFFLNVSDYDFRKQIDLALLYIVYHCIGNERNSTDIKKIKIKKILIILNNKKVRAMFLRIRINTLDISWKLKIYTYVYKCISYLGRGEK